MRARFHVESITKHSSGATSVVLMPNIRGPNEKTKLWKGIPHGSLDMTITNPDAQDFFQVGKDYYLDFTLVEPSEDVD